MRYPNIMAAIKEQLLPVGSIIEWCPVSGGPDLSTPDKVAAYYGFGQWEAFGTSQATVGTDKLHAPGHDVGQPRNHAECCQHADDAAAVLRRQPFRRPDGD